MKTTVKTDLYTKVILTVIAVCLTVNLLKDFNIVTLAQASTPPIASITEESQKKTSAKKEVIDVNIVQVGGNKVTGGYSGGLPVRISNK